MMEHSHRIALLRQDVVPAPGCREPVCVALTDAEILAVMTGNGIFPT